MSSRDGDAGRLGHERHHGPLLGRRGRGALLRARRTSTQLRSIALAYVDSRLIEDDEVEIDVRGRRVPGLVVPYHLRSDAPPCARAIVWDSRAAAHRARGRRGRREGPAAARRRHRQPRLAPGRSASTSSPSEMTASPMARLLSITRPGLPLRRAQEDRGLLRPRGLLLPGHRFHRRGRAPARRRAARLPRLPRGRDPRDQRPDGQHRRVQRPGRLPQPRRPQGRAAPHRQGDQQPHRPRRPPERPAHGRPARLRRPRPAHRDARGRRHPGAGREPVQGRRAGAPRPHREGAPRAHHPRQEHGAAPGAGVRGPHVPRRAGLRRGAHVRHGARPRPRRAALPAAVRGGRRHRHRLDAQDVLRHAARHHRRPLAGARGALRPVGGDRAPRLPRLREQPPPRHPARPAHGGLRDEPLQGRLPAGRDRQRQGLRGGAQGRRAGRRRRPGRRLHRDASGDRRTSATAGARRSPAGSRRTTSSATTRRRPTKRASPRRAPCASASPR